MRHRSLSLWRFLTLGLPLLWVPHAAMPYVVPSLSVYRVTVDGVLFTVSVIQEGESRVPQLQARVLDAARNLYVEEFLSRGTLIRPEDIGKMTEHEYQKAQEEVTRKLRKSADKMLDGRSTLITVAEGDDPTQVIGMVRPVYSRKYKPVPVVKRLGKAGEDLSELKQVQKVGPVMEVSSFVMKKGSPPGRTAAAMSPFILEDLKKWQARHAVSPESLFPLIQTDPDGLTALYRRAWGFEKLKAYPIDPDFPWKGLSVLYSSLGKFSSRLQGMADQVSSVEPVSEWWLGANELRIRRGKEFTTYTDERRHLSLASIEPRQFSVGNRVRDCANSFRGFRSLRDSPWKYPMGLYSRGLSGRR